MSEMLTTGQMIDSLKTGEVAERVWTVTGTCHDRFSHAKKDEDGDLWFGDGEDWELERLSGSLINSQWIIIK